MRRALLVVALLVGTAAADGGAFTAELTGGAGYVFSASKDTLTDPRGRIIHQRGGSPALAFGFGGFVAARIALFGRVSCTDQLVCFLGPSVQLWPHEQVWVGGGFGLGTDPNCIGGQKTCGVDTCSCEMGATALDLGVGASLEALHGASVHLDFVRVGDLVAGRSANSLSLQLGYQWH